MKGVGMERHRRTGRTHPGGRASTPHPQSSRRGANAAPAVEPEGGKRRAPSSRWGDKHPAP